MKYRKKPVTIEAEQWFPPEVWPDLYPTMDARPEFNKSVMLVDEGIAQVSTIHKGQTVRIESGDFIIPEPDGIHFYPCKPDIFAASYSPATDPTPSSAEVYRKALEKIADKSRELLPERFNVDDKLLSAIYTILHTAREALSHSSQPEQVKGEDWISVDKPPKKRIRVIGWPDVGGYDIVHVDLDGQWKTDDGVPVKYPIIKWQPLPKPPRDHPGLDHRGAEQI